MQRLATVVILAAFALSGAVTSAQVSGKSDTCIQVEGKTAKDRDNALAFCKAGVPKDLGVTGAMAMESLLWLKVSRPTANLMMADPLSTEQIVKNWMGAWKKLSGSKAVTVYVEWGDVEIAKGDTTLFSGDKVTVKGR